MKELTDIYIFYFKLYAYFLFKPSIQATVRNESFYYFSSHLSCINVMYFVKNDRNLFLFLYIIFLSVSFYFSINYCDILLVTVNLHTALFWKIYLFICLNAAA